MVSSCLFRVAPAHFRSCLLLSVAACCCMLLLVAACCALLPLVAAYCRLSPALSLEIARGCSESCSQLLLVAPCSRLLCFVVPCCCFVAFFDVPSPLRGRHNTFASSPKVLRHASGCFQAPLRSAPFPFHAEIGFAKRLISRTRV